MSNFITTQITFTSGNKVCQVTDGANISAFLSGDVVFVVGYLPLVIESVASPAITLKNPAPLSATSEPAAISAGTVPVRNILSTLQSFSDSFASWFSQMDIWLTELGQIGVIGPSGTIQVSTLPQILLDVSSQTQTINANLDLIGDAPIYAQEAKDARDAAQQAETGASEQVTLATAQVTLATEQKNAAQQAVTDATAQVPLAAAQVTLATAQVTLATEQKTAAQQAVTDATAQVPLAAAQVTLASDQVALATAQVSLAVAEKNTTTALRNETQGYRDEALQAAQGLTGGMFLAGDWDASGGTAPPTPSEGSPFYKISGAGTINAVDYGINDNIVYNNITSTWFKIDNTESVFSVNGQMGTVNLAAADVGALPTAGKAADSAKLNGVTEAEAATASTIVKRTGAGDINARLFRSEYATTNATINFIMTQVDTASNNYMRPSTPAQFRAAVTDGYYRPIGYVPSWGEITGKPTEFAPSNHDASKITSGILPLARGGTGRSDGKAPALITARTITVALSGDASGSANATFDGSANKTITIPVTVADNSHSHAIANVAGLQSALDTLTTAAAAGGQITYNNAGSQTFTRQAVNTYINRSTTTAATYTLDESTFLVGDKVYVTRFYTGSANITITTTTGAIFDTTGASAATQTLGVAGTICLEKIDTGNWIARVA